MVTIIAEFHSKNECTAMELEALFQKLIEEPPGEAGYIAYEVLRTKNIPDTYNIIEKWASERDLQNYAELVASKGYAASAAGLLKNELNNSILRT